jgi:quercetin dioxygenase-like cupin family protein
LVEAKQPKNASEDKQKSDGDTNQEERYLALEGSGTLYAEGQTYPMQRGVLIRVGAATKRKIVPEPKGMILLVLGDRPG